MISLIVAVSANNVIGRGGELPWRLLDDLKRFKVLTMGKPIIMGRRTHEAIGRPLPGRQNIVISRQTEFSAPGCETVESPQAAISAAVSADEIFVIGGGQIYEQFLPRTERIYMTRVHVEVPGDAYFPPLDPSQWRESERTTQMADDNNEYDLTFVTLDRR